MVEDPALAAVKRVLEANDRIAYALVFGSAAREVTHARSDLDLAIEAQEPISARDLGRLQADLEAAADRPVDLVLLSEAPPALAYRAFRDGKLLFERDHRRLVNRKERAILDYLDFRPVETQCARGVLRAIADGR